MAWYDPGKKVKCVKVGAWTHEPTCPGERYPRYGDELTVREVLLRPSGIHLRFEEIRNPECCMFAGLPSEATFNVIRFRPIRSTETGMRVLREIASRKRQTVDAPNLEDAE